MNWIQQILRALPVLKTTKNPTAALVVGFLFGGIGLAIYFRKVIDFFIPVFLIILLEILHSQFRGQGELYVLAGAVVAAAYGYFRATFSNEALATVQEAPRAYPSPGGTHCCLTCGEPSDPAAAFCARCGTRRSGQG